MSATRHIQLRNNLISYSPEGLILFRAKSHLTPVLIVKHTDLGGQARGVEQKQQLKGGSMKSLCQDTEFYCLLLPSFSSCRNIQRSRVYETETTMKMDFSSKPAQASAAVSQTATLWFRYNQKPAAWNLNRS